MNSYKQLAYEQRYQISFMLKMGFSQTRIAMRLVSTDPRSAGNCVAIEANVATGLNKRTKWLSIEEIKRIIASRPSPGT